MRDADGEGGGAGFPRPGAAVRVEDVAQPVAEHVVAGVGRHLERYTHGHPCQRGVADRARRAGVAMLHHGFRAGKQHLRTIDDDNFDIDIADDGKRSHRYSERVILVVRSGMPTSDTR